MINDETLSFSFSGLKTAIVRETEKYKTMKQWNDETINAIAFEVQEAIADVLVEKTLRSARQYNAKSILLSGGVAANLRLREKFSSKLDARSPKLALHVPLIDLCTDNAVYIGSYAYFRGIPVDWHRVSAQPDLSVEECSSSYLGNAS